MDVVARDSASMSPLASMSLSDFFRRPSFVQRYQALNVTPVKPTVTTKYSQIQGDTFPCVVSGPKSKKDMEKRLYQTDHGKYSNARSVSRRSNSLEDFETRYDAYSNESSRKENVTVRRRRTMGA